MKLSKNPIASERELVAVHDKVWTFHDSPSTTGVDGEKPIIKQIDI